MRSRYKRFCFYFPHQVIECVNRHRHWRVVGCWRIVSQWHIEFDPIRDELSNELWLKQWRRDYPLDRHATEWRDGLSV